MSMAVMFDKLRYVEKLRSGGVPEEHARAGAEALNGALEEWGTGMLASRADLHETRDTLRLELQGVRGELKADNASLRGELKADIASLRNELQVDMAALRTELKGDVAGLRNEFLEMKVELKDDLNYVRLELGDLRSEFRLMKWMMAFVMAGMGTILTRLFL